MRPERRNTVKVLMFFDIGGSMDWHIKTAEELFSAARTEFKHLEYYLLPQLPLRVRLEGQRPPLDRAHADLAGAAQVPGRLQGDLRRRRFHEPLRDQSLGGSVEHMNEEPGALWLQRVTDIYEHCVWLNPVPETHWGWTPSIAMIRRLVGGRMYPLTLEGLDSAMRELMR